MLTPVKFQMWRTICNKFGNSTAKKYEKEGKRQRHKYEYLLAKEAAVRG